MEDWGLINVELKDHENLRYDSDKCLFYLISTKIDYSCVLLKFITNNCDGLMIGPNKINCDEFIKLDITNPIDVIVYKDEETKNYTIQGFDVGVPVISINIDYNNDVKKDEWQNSNISIFDDNHNNIINDKIKIRGRGQGSWNFSKKSYTIKFNDNVSLFDMAPSKKWCLLSLYQDDILIKTDVAFFISKKSNLSYTPNGKYVELNINGKELGLYYLCEKVEVNKKKVNINKFDENNLDNSGFLFYINCKNKNVIYTNEDEVHFNLKYPKAKNIKNQERLNKYLSEKLSKIDNLLKKDPIDINEVSKYIDLNSLIDYLLIIETIVHNDVFSFYVCLNNLYIYLNNGKIYFGPLWDLDTIFGDYYGFIALKSTPNGGFQPFGKPNPNSNKHKFYNNYLIKSPEFINLVINRWNIFKNELNDIDEYIDLLYDKIKIALKHNKILWPYKNHFTPFTGFAPSINLPFPEAKEKLKEIIHNRIQWLDENLPKLLNSEES